MARFQVIDESSNFSGSEAEITFQIQEGQPGGVPDGFFFEVLNYFSELDTQQKKMLARQSLELEHIDGGTF